MIKEKIKGQKQLNHVTLMPMSAVGSKSLYFAQNILARYGISRGNSNFPALVFRYYLSLLAGTAEGENSGSTEVIKRVVDRLHIYYTIADRTGKINQLPYAGNAEPAPVLNLSSPEVIQRVAGHLNIYNYITNEAGKTSQPSYTGNAPAPMLNLGSPEVIQRIAGHLNIYNNITQYAGNVESAPVLNVNSPEVVKKVIEHLNIYNIIADRTDKTSQPTYAGNTEPAPVLNLSSPEVIQRVAGHLNIYNNITQYASNTEPVPVLNVNSPEVVKRGADRLNIYNTIANEVGKRSQPTHAGNTEPDPVLFNTARVWMTYVKEKYFTHAVQRVPGANISNFAAKQGSANKVVSQFENAFPLNREATDWRGHSIQEPNNLITPRTYNRISAAGLPGHLPLREKSASDREQSSGIQLTCLIQNIRSIDQRLLFDTLPEASLNHGDAKPALQNTDRKGNITDLHKFPERGPDAKSKSSSDKGRTGPDRLQEALITGHGMTAAIRDDRTARMSNPPTDVREERLTVNHREIMQQDRLIFSKHVIKEVYDVEAVQPSGRPLKQGEEVHPVSSNIPGQLQDTANRISASFSKSRMDHRSPKIMLTVKDHVAAATTSRAARKFGPASSAREENLTGKYDAGNRIKLQYKNEAGNETRGEDIVNQAKISDLARYKEAVRQGGLILHKPITRETAAAKEERMPQAAPPEEKKANTRTVNTQKQLQNIRDMGSEEINLLAERVFKVLEKRIAIQKDRRGLL